MAAETPAPAIARQELNLFSRPLGFIAVAICQIFFNCILEQQLTGKWFFNMKVTIRLYKGEDYPKLRELLNIIYGSTIDQEMLEKQYITDDRQILVAANENDMVVGCTFIEVRKDYIRQSKVLFVTYVAVDESCRKQGIGRSLLMKVEEVSRHYGCTAVELTSADYRTEAHLFYKSLGFTRKKTTVFIKEVD